MTDPSTPLGTGLGDAIAADARLYILKELAGQTDGRLNAILLQRLLEKRYGINRSREWVETQLRKLAELDTIALLDGELTIAEIRRPGRDHLAARSIVAGVTRPSEVE